MSEVTVYGATYSVYVRAVRLTLAQKGVPYDLVEIDVFTESGPPADYLERHPFGRVPAFEHAGFRLFETSAITRYVNEAFDGPNIIPSDSKRAARVNQIVSMADSYVYPAMVWGVFVERMRVPEEGGVPDEAKIAAGLETAQTCIATLSSLMGDARFLAGPDITLADIYMIPMLAYFREAPEGARLLGCHPPVTDWLERMMERPDVAAILGAS